MDGGLKKKLQRLSDTARDFWKCLAIEIGNAPSNCFLFSLF